MRKKKEINQMIQKEKKRKKIKKMIIIQHK